MKNSLSVWYAVCSASLVRTAIVLISIYLSAGLTAAAQFLSPIRETSSSQSRPDFEQQNAKVMARMEASLKRQHQAAARQTARYATSSISAQSASPAAMLLPAPAEDSSVEVEDVLAGNGCAPLGRDQVDALAGLASRQARLSTQLLSAVMERESAFQPCAVSSKGALGLMQLMPATANELGVSDPFDPAENALGGARYLRRLLDSYQGNLRMALAAYNAGPGTVREAGGLPPFPETVHYVESILERLENKGEER